MNKYFELPFGFFKRNNKNFYTALLKPARYVAEALAIYHLSSVG
jgi:hypothetical protein